MREEGICQGRAIKQTDPTEGSLLVTAQVSQVEALAFRAS